MAIPEEIRKVERPKNTIVKLNGKRYIVISRSCRRVNGKPTPYYKETVGEIIDGKYVARVVKEKKQDKKTIDIKDYGEVAICHKHASGLLENLAKVWSLDDAKRLYTIAVLRAAYGDVKNRDLMMHYDTSFMSEFMPGIHLSEQAVSNFLQEIGQGYSQISTYMRNRIGDYSGKDLVVDGMLKNYNSEDGYMSEYSRKARTKGSKDMSLLYAFDPKSKEPIAMKPYPGNMLDQTTIKNFISEYKIENGLLIADKGFSDKELMDDIDSKKDLAYLVPLKQNAKFIENYKMDEPTELLSEYKDATILFKKEKMSGGGFLYSFRDPRIAYEQEIVYVQKASKQDKFNSDNYSNKKSRFGLIVFKSKKDISPYDIYLAYTQRWSIEVMFNMYKNILERDSVNVHSDYRVYATEFINFLSVLITARVKNEIVKKDLNKKYSYKQVFKYLATYKKVRTEKDGSWMDSTLLKYVEELTNELNV